MKNYGFHIMRYHGGGILFWFANRFGTRYEVAEQETLGL